MPIVKSVSVRTTVQKSLAYILNPDKTEELLYTASLNCMTDAEDAYLNMKMVYEQYCCHGFDEPIPKNGNGRVKAIHYIQSFSPEENITPEQAHRIAKAFVRKTFGDDCQAVIATHTDKKHVHSHIILNSYSITGRKFYDNKTSRNHVREYSDRVCLAFGIQPITAGKRKSKGNSYAEWQNKKNGTSWKELIRQEIDLLIPQVKNLNELLAILEERGFTVRRSKSILVKAPNQKRAVRLENLGDIYSPESLDIRIHYSDAESVQRSSKTELQLAYEFVIGEVRILAQSGQKVQRCRNRSLPYSAENDLDIYKLSAHLTIINRDRIRSIGEVTAKMADMKQQYENARVEINRLTAELDKLDSLAKQADHYFSLTETGVDLSDADKLMLAMERETLDRNNIHSREDYVRISEKHHALRNQVSALKAQYEQAKHFYEVYADIAETYRSISEGDYISRLVKEKQQEEQHRKNAAKKGSR